jgi:HK97 family phage prohead protease
MTIVRKTEAGKVAGSLTYVLSDDTLDRMGDIIDPAGWDLRWFRKNPIALFGHNSSAPIGRWKNIRVEGGRLVAELEPAQRGTSQRIDEILSLIDQDILRATSVGFRPIEFEPIDEKNPYRGTRYTKQELLETSIVSVPANPAALQLAKSLRISGETMSLAFGEHAETRRRDMAPAGGNASKPHSNMRPPAMITLSQRIEDAQNALNAKHDKLAELTGAEILDVDAIEAINEDIAAEERSLAALKASEAKIGVRAVRDAGIESPAVNRRPLGFPQKKVDGLDLLVRAITVRGIATFGPGNKTIERVLDERYPGQEATAIIAKADQTIGTTTVSGWASELVQETWAGFMGALTGVSIYPALRDRGQSFSFDGNGTVNIPSRTAGGASGGFFAEGAPIRVGRITTASAPMTARQMGVIVAFSRKLAMQSTPSIEAVVRQGIIEDTAAALDPLLLDAVAADTARPAGLLNGVSATASGFGGGDYQAVIADFKALLQPFIDANAADTITVIMNSAQGLGLALMDGPIGNPDWFGSIRNRLTIVESTHATAGRLIAIRNSDFVTALGDGPEFDVSEQATIHLEDTTPLEIVSGTGPTVADPVRSLWQTGSVGIRMIADISWAMRRTGMVRWIDGVTW